MLTGVAVAVPKLRARGWWWRLALGTVAVTIAAVCVIAWALVAWDWCPGPYNQDDPTHCGQSGNWG